MKRTNTKRQQLIRSWIALGVAIAQDEHTYERKAEQQFMHYGWDFDPKAVLLKLLSKEEGFFEEKSIIFAGLCAWIIFPDDRSLVRQAMMLKGQLILRQAEKQGRRLFPESRAFGEIAGRILVPGVSFYDDFYFPVSKTLSWTQLGSRREHRATLKAQFRYVKTICDMMKLYHWHAHYLREGGEHERMSLDKCSLILGKHAIAERSKNVKYPEKTFERHWHKLGVSAAMIYSAHSIEIEPSITLLSLILENRLNYGRYRNQIDVWLGRARYAAGQIIQHLAEPKYAKASLDYLPPGDQYQIPPPIYTEEEAKRIKEYSRPYRLREKPLSSKQ